MATQMCTEDVLVIDLPPEIEMRDELDAAIRKVSRSANRGVVIDFSHADIVTSASLSRLLRLRKLLVDRGRRLVLCGLAANTKAIFAVTGLDKVFEFGYDRSAVLSQV
jgi:anti-anti-sigma factor